MYWQDEIAASNGDTRRLWRTLKGVLSDHGGEDVSVHKGVLSDHGGEDVSVHKGVLSDHGGEDLSVNTPHDFATYFKDKVESVRLSTSTTP